MLCVHAPFNKVLTFRFGVVKYRIRYCGRIDKDFSCVVDAFGLEVCPDCRGMFYTYRRVF